MNYNRHRIEDRSIDEMIGICKGIVADNEVNHSEALFLQDWMETNVPCSEDQMVNQIYRRIHEMLIDKVFDKEESQELLSLLQMFTGQGTTLEIAANMTATLPLDAPAPPVIFEDRIFCFTGKFAYGPRRVCENAVLHRGGTTKPKLNRGVDYLVMGFLGSPDWIHSSYGRKIEMAMHYREENGNPAIITKDHWAEYAFRK